MIRFDEVQLRFGEHVVLDGVTLDVPDGSTTVLLGRSGAGKSVLLKQVVGLIRPTAGAVWVDDLRVDTLDREALVPLRRQVGYVFQFAALFDSMTCEQNVALPLRKHMGLTMKDALTEARERLSQVHMSHFATAYPAEIGDGMRKRVAIARALTLKPSYVLFDEPTTSLDPVSARRTDVMIRELCDQFGVTSIVVSHDLVSIFGIADRIAMLYQGNVRLLGTREDFKNTDDPVVRQFMSGEAEGPMQV